MSGSVDLALVVGAARSGTTLLRNLLDAHPEVGCPPEAGLPALMAHMARVWATVGVDTGVRDPDGPMILADPGRRHDHNRDCYMLEGERDTTSGGVTHGVAISETASQWIRMAATEIMSRYCESGQKRLYVDKSLDSVFYLDLVRRLFPQTRCVLVFRHVMDTIASGIEASPWGFQAYGYQPYVQMTPGNVVSALAQYWLDHVNEQLAWESRYPEACVRVIYEDLVLEPARVILEVQRFLGVKQDVTVLAGAFSGDVKAGPGDYKIDFTTEVHSSSVGRGKRIPIDLLPPQMLALVNAKLALLGYPPLDRSWNAVERDVELSASGVWSDRLEVCMERLVIAPCSTQSYTFAVVAEDHRCLRWVVDLELGEVVRGDGEVDSVLTGTAEDLSLLLTREENAGVLLRTGRVRHIASGEMGVEEARRELDLILEALWPCRVAKTGLA